ncbi:PEP-CTERM sorting domain-containing protein [Ruficoccus sp. ZRK36]|uniref:PEP-CTERM sorting domain-containing protein n=1 Tax=Ruficoccus sp. ZRK36 TaxID=2866311 RepID=UPI001C736FD6|nr:PEP-CTERM sorting domain-containing protein [Ruficoccus sp. ZRK36]QYY34395.1 PEP-CTERM sorting domain-containing protein [Ruficoccus sp. ZRK36]
MKTTKLIALTAALLAPAVSHADFMAFNLPGNTETGSWTDLNPTNYPTYPSSYPGSDTWPDPITASGIDADLNITAGGSYFSSSDYIYNASASTYTISSGSPITDLSTLVLQFENAQGMDTITLSYNGGSQELAASYIGNYAGSHTYNGGGQTGSSTIDVYQWDLSSIESTITDYSITFTTNAHAILWGISLTEGDTYSAIAVPEPSTYAALAGLGVLTVVLLRRRKLSQK